MNEKEKEQITFIVKTYQEIHSELEKLEETIISLTKKKDLLVKKLENNREEEKKLIETLKIKYENVLETTKL